MAGVASPLIMEHHRYLPVSPAPSGHGDKIFYTFMAFLTVPSHYYFISFIDDNLNDDSGRNYRRIEFHKARPRSGALHLLSKYK